MGTQTRRDMAVTAAILGFFASGWFGWTSPPQWLAPWLIAGSVLSVLLLVVGVALAVRHRANGSALSERAAGRRYGITVGVEFALVGAGAAVLGATGANEYLPVWACAVVGAHFVPLAAPLRDPSLRILAVVMLAIAAAGLVTGLATDVDASNVTGTGTGVAMLAWGVAEALRTRRVL